MTTGLLSSPRLFSSFSWRGFGVFLLFAFGLTAWNWSGLLLTNKMLTLHEHGEYFASLLQRNVLNYFPMYLLASLADGLPLTGRRRTAALALAVIAGALFAVQLRCAVTPNQWFYVYGSTQLPYCTSFPTWRTYFDFPATFIAPVTMGGLVLVFILGLRRHAELTLALRAAGTAQLESRRQRIESEIDAMHARVDPDALLDTLRTVRGLYDKSRAEGEARLEALIQELRHAARHPSADAPPQGAE